MLAAALQHEVDLILAELALAAGEAWVVPLRVRVSVTAKMRPKLCPEAACGYEHGETPLSLVIALSFSTGLSLSVEREFGSADTKIRSR